MKKHVLMVVALILSLLLVATTVLGCHKKPTTPGNESENTPADKPEDKPGDESNKEPAKAVSFTIDDSLIAKEAKVGDTIAVDKLKATVLFDDESKKELSAAELEFYFGDTKLEGTTFAGLTDAEGHVEISVKYLTFTKTITVTVIPLTMNDLYAMTSFSLPTSETHRTANAESFLDKTVDVSARIVGDDNPFLFLPLLRVYDYSAEEATDLNNYETVSVIKTEDGAPLTAEDDLEAKTTKYYLGTELIATSYYSEGKYQFTSAAVGNTYVVSILPRELECEEDDAVSVTLEIVDGLNVYDAKDLAIIDNTSQKDWSVGDEWAENPDVWADIRAEKGFTIEQSNATKAVILQKDIAITADDLPYAYVGTVKRDLVYYDFSTGEEAKTVVNAKRLTHDANGNLFIYERISDEDFAFYGNFYTLDASGVPLVSAFDEEAVETDEFGNALTISNYGSDTSNAALFRFEGTKAEFAERANYSFENLNVVGNANTEQWVIYGPNDPNRTQDALAVNAGGFIFVKVNHCNLASSNLNMNRCFIGYLLEDSVKATADSIYVNACYQDVAFIWGECEMEVSNSVLKNAGGPLFILQHVEPLENPNSRIPKLSIVDSEVENFVTGNEMWFTDRGASGVIPQLKAAVNGFLEGISAQISAAYSTTMPIKTATKNVGNRENCLNLICLIMSNGSGGDALGTTETQGYCSITENEKTYILNRMADAGIRAVLASGTATFNADEDTGFFYATGMEENPIAYMGSDAAAAVGAIYEGNYLSFNQTGMGLVLGTFTK